ncbi:CRISPR-associated endonuclease Cas1 [Actinokineospora cianjurensis]|uniref:CRISPR-associated endonuclease Cas1 n=1 Tax=Actinokineospora cianjurensis TaxID=585224 RepID=A0A421B207_9PSEU|nr:CRISPR-associated endonuclease Cas1 [Actinokineospora cianjurensis]RLK58378.1 CRISPR-associated endonuclease Cas1 [Actinokineospora cianjurensis]
MPAASRTYWLTTTCRIRRKDESLVIERPDTDKVHIPITDVRDIVACAEVDINTAVVALLNRHRINIHLLSHYGDYAGSLLTSDTSTSGETVLAQARTAGDPTRSLAIARSLVDSCAFNVRRVTPRMGTHNHRTPRHPLTTPTKHPG